jgi:GTP cyclohydrolase I
VPVCNVTYILKWVKRFSTVNTEKVTKNIVDKVTRNTPHNGTLIVFSSASRCMKLCQILQEGLCISSSTLQCLFGFEFSYNLA